MQDRICIVRHFKQSKGEYFLREMDYMHQSVCDRKERYVNPFTYCVFILHLN